VKVFTRSTSWWTGPNSDGPEQSDLDQHEPDMSVDNPLSSPLTGTRKHLALSRKL
jgi:hypothetical protein